MVKMKKTFWILLLMVLLLAGCVKEHKNEKPNPAGSIRTADSAPTYEKKVVTYPLAEDANPYAIKCCENGFFYYALGANDEGENAYHFFYQPFDGTPYVSFGSVDQQYVRDFAGNPVEGKTKLFVLCMGECAEILEFDGADKPVREMPIDNEFNDLESFPKLLIMQDGGYVIGMSDRAYFLDEEGRTTESTQLNGTVSSLFASDAGEIFAITEKNENGKVQRLLERVQEGKKRSETVRELAEDAYGVYAFEDGFSSVYSNCMTFFTVGKTEEEAVIDFDRQSIVASQIQGVFGNMKEIRLFSLDVSSSERKARMFTLFPIEEKKETNKTEKKEKQEKYAADGRRIVRVAIPDGCPFQVEYHAKKYSQESEKALIQVERFKGTLEDYLGKGNRPDVIMFTDHTELDAYVQKGVLVDMLPMFEAWDSSELEGMIPKARELLGNGSEDVMYAMANRFQLLLRTSNGEELNAYGKCNAVDYLKWYGDFMTDMEYGGMGTLENVLYAYVPHFYEEDPVNVCFISPGFMDLMKAYKTLLEEHGGPVSISYGSNSQKEIAKGPRWQSTYRRYELTEPGISMEGLPWADGSSRVYIRLCDPLAILSTSECPQDAFNFIAYYTSLRLPLMKGEPEGDYGKGGNTEALFSVWGKYLREEIYESERSYGYYEDHTAAFFTEEQSEHLKQLICDAVPDTKTQRDIYEMLLEEMDAYWQGGKTLESACEVLQNRAELYLKEQ